jgi:hypothetical protein
MRCPNCGLGINFEEQEEYTALYSYDDPEKAGLGYELVHGHCPDCGKLIVILKEGKHKRSEYGSSLSEITKEEVIFPKVILPKKLESEIPQNYRDDYMEAYAVLPVSPKASAAISRRLLQHILREEYKIKKGSLDKEIEEFIHLGNVPSHIGEAVDAVRNVGNFAAHPLKDTSTGVVVDVEPGEAEWLLEVIDALFDFTFVQPRKLQERKSRLNAKLAAMGKPPIKS